MELELKARVGDDILDSAFPGLYNEDPDTGMIVKNEYTVKGMPVKKSFLKITRNSARVSLSDIVCLSYSKDAGQKPEDIPNYDAIRKNFERNFKCLLKDFEIEQYKNELKTSKGVYQFSDEDIPFLKSLVDGKYYIQSKNEAVAKDDFLWYGVGLYSCFYHIENINSNILKDIGNIIYEKIGIPDLSYYVPLDWRMRSMKECVQNIMLSGLSDTDKYETMIKDIDALLDKWNKL